MPAPLIPQAPLSLKAQGLYDFLLAHPEDTRPATLLAISAALRQSGRHAGTWMLRSALQELFSAGYAKRVQARFSNGTIGETRLVMCHQEGAADAKDAVPAHTLDDAPTPAKPPTPDVPTGTEDAPDMHAFRQIALRFESHDIAVQIDAHGNPWWVAKEVCDVLGILNVSQAIERLKPLESTIICKTYNGIPHRLALVNEPGLYRLIFRSNKPEAERFQDWVFGEVLPALRKTGTYTVPGVTPAPAADPAVLTALTDLRQELAAFHTTVAQRVERVETHQVALDERITRRTPRTRAIHASTKPPGYYSIKAYTQALGLGHVCPAAMHRVMGARCQQLSRHWELPVHCDGSTHFYACDVLCKVFTQEYGPLTSVSYASMD